MWAHHGHRSFDPKVCFHPLQMVRLVLCKSRLKVFGVVAIGIGLVRYWHAKMQAERLPPVAQIVDQQLTPAALSQ